MIKRAHLVEHKDILESDLNAARQRDIYQEQSCPMLKMTHGKAENGKELKKRSDFLKRRN